MLIYILLCFGLFSLLSRRDIAVVVENGSPFLFKNGEESVRRMRSFLGNVSIGNFICLNFG